MTSTLPYSPERVTFGRKFDDSSNNKRTHSSGSSPKNHKNGILGNSLSSRYEKLTGKSPSAELLTSSLEDLLKTLKNKFAKPDTKGDLEPFEAIQNLLRSGGSSSKAGKLNLVNKKVDD